MAASDEARRFLRKAAQDEYVAARLLADPAAPDEQLGFHAQQAVEQVRDILGDFDHSTNSHLC